MQREKYLKGMGRSSWMLLCVAFLCNWNSGEGACSIGSVWSCPAGTFSSTGTQTTAVSSCDHSCDRSCDFLGLSCDYCTGCDVCPVPTRFYPETLTTDAIDAAVARGFGCKWCQPGRYNPHTRQTRCTDCPAGRYTSLQTRVSLGDCLSCPEGKVGSRGGLDSATKCQTCVAGQYSKAGDTSCTKCGGCDVGWYRLSCGGGNPGKSLTLDLTLDPNP